MRARDAGTQGTWMVSAGEISEQTLLIDDIHLFAEHWVHDEIGGVGFDGTCSRWRANYMREIHSLNVQVDIRDAEQIQLCSTYYSLGGDRGKVWGSGIAEVRLKH